MNDLTYNLPNNLGVVVFTSTSLRSMFAYRQNSFLKREAGGQLFGTFEQNIIRITEATQPRKQDKRTRFGFLPHRPSEQKEISKRYSESGSHFMGDWHTHPQKIPQPSQTDRDSVIRMLELSNHDVQGILLVVIGTQDAPQGLYVGFCMSGQIYDLSLSN